MNRDWLPRRRTLGDVLAHRISDAQLTLLLQQQNRRRRKLFRDRANAKLSLRRVRRIRLEVRNAITAIHHDVPVAGDEQRAVKAICRCLRVHVVSDLWNNALGRHRGLRVCVRCGERAPANSTPADNVHGKSVVF